MPFTQAERPADIPPIPAALRSAAGIRNLTATGRCRFGLCLAYGVWMGKSCLG